LNTLDYSLNLQDSYMNRLIWCENKILEMNTTESYAVFVRMCSQAS